MPMLNLLLTLLLCTFKLCLAKLTLNFPEVPKIFLNESQFQQTFFNILVSDEQLNVNTLIPFIRTSSKDLKNCLDTMEYKPDTFTIPVKDSASLQEILAKNSPLPGTSKFIIITDNCKEVDGLAQVLWKHQYFHSVIYCDNQQYFIDVKQCGSEEIVRASSNSKTLPDCPVYVIWAEMSPFINNISASSFKGIFVDLLEVLRHFNIEIIYRPYDPIYLEDISSSYNYESVLEDFDSGYGQVFLGPADLHGYSIMHLSPLLIDNSLSFLVPKRKVSYWLMANTIFSSDIVIFLFIEFLIIVSYFCIARRTEDKHLYRTFTGTFYFFYGYILGVSTMKRLPRNDILRIYLGGFLCQIFLMIICTQSSLVSSMTGSIYGKSIENIDELLDSDLDIKLINGMQFLFRVPRDEKDKEVLNRFEVFEHDGNLFQAGKLALRDKNFATIIDTGFLLMMPNILKSFSTFEVYSIKQVIAMPKNAYFTEQYDYWISRILEMGMMPKLNSLYQHFYALKYFVIEDKRDIVLTMGQFKPVLTFMMCDLLLGSTVLILEILFNKYSQRFIRVKKLQFLIRIVLFMRKFF